MGVAPLLNDFINAPRALEKPKPDAPEDAARLNEANSGAICDPEQSHFRARVEHFACEKVNSHFWMSGPAVWQRSATPALLHSPARHGALARARHWVWFMLYRHPFSAGISTPAMRPKLRPLLRP